MAKALVRIDSVFHFIEMYCVISRCLFDRLSLLGSLALVLCILLVGCATNQAPKRVHESLPAGELGERSAQNPSMGPMFDAKYRDLVTCTSQDALSAERPMNEITFSCGKANGVFTATLPQMKDAGWGMETIDVGKEFTQDGSICFPLTITMRKLL